MIINTESISIRTNLHSYYFKLPTYFVYWAKSVYISNDINYYIISICKAIDVKADITKWDSLWLWSVLCVEWAITTGHIISKTIVFCYCKKYNVLNNVFQTIIVAYFCLIWSLFEYENNKSSVFNSLLDAVAYNWLKLYILDR